MKLLKWNVTREDLPLASENISAAFDQSSIKPAGQTIEDYTQWYSKSFMNLIEGITLQELTDAVKELRA